MTCLVVVPLEDEKLKEAEAKLTLKTIELVKLRESYSRLQAILKECQKSHSVELISATRKELEETKKKLEQARGEVEELKQEKSTISNIYKEYQRNEQDLSRRTKRKQKKAQGRLGKRLKERRARKVPRHQTTAFHI